MSHKTLIVVTLTAVMMHALLGCCWHHDHPPNSSSIESVSLTAACCCHHHLSESESADGHRNDGDHQSCDGVECIFYSPDHASLEQPVMAALGMPATGDLKSSTVLGLDRRRYANEVTVGRSQLPQRLHALKQVWLIWLLIMPGWANK